MVFSSQNLFKTVEIRLTPLNITVIKSYVENGLKTTYLYFNGHNTDQGVARIFGILREPQNAKTAALVLPDAYQDIVKSDLSPLHNLDIATLIIDYAGNYLDKERFTIYPNSLNLNYSDSADFDINNIKKFPQYHYTLVSLRAFYLLENYNYNDYFVIGLGDATALSIRAQALEEKVKFGIHLFSAPRLTFEETDVRSFSYLASYAEESYVPLIKTPLLFVVSSNATRSPASRYSELFELCKNKNSRLSIYPSPIEKLNSRVIATALNFIGANCFGSILFDSPTISESDDDERYLYSEVSGAKKVKLYYALNENEKTRLWFRTDAEKIGEKSYLTRLKVKKAVSVTSFFNAIYPDGTIYSSVFNTKKIVYPESEAIKKNHVVYNDEISEEYFYDDRGEFAKLNSGVFDIQGLRVSGSLSTLLLSDENFRGEKDDSLDFLVYSDINQEVTFTIVSNDGITYVCKINVSPDEKWQKIIINYRDFKSLDGSTLNWQEILTFNIKAENLLINSILWV